MLKKQPHIALLVMAFLLLLLGFAATGENTLDVNVHDTYFVIAQRYLYWLLGEILSVFFIFYWILERIKVTLIPILSKIHIYGMAVSVLAFFFPYSLVTPKSDSILYDNMQYVNLCLMIAALLFLFLQILFIINIFVSIIKKLKNSAA